MGSAATSARAVIRFGAFEFDAIAGELRKRGMKLKLEGQPILLLQMLLETPGELVTREELQRRLWPADTFVDFEQGINSAVKRLRQVLDDSADTPRYIETLPRRGYRFVYPLEPAAASSAESELKSPPVRRRRWPIVLFGTAALVVVTGLVYWRIGRKAASPAPPIRRLAVLPLQNLTGYADQDYFVDGLHDELITQLAQIHSLTVISRTSVMRFKRSDKPLREIARELGADGVLEGAVRRSGSRVQVTAQLIEASSDRHLWAQSFETEVRDVLTLQTQVARAIAREVGVEVSPREQMRMAAARVPGPEAYEAFLKGRYFREQRTVEGFRKGIEYYRQAISLDPDYALAYAGLADCYNLLGAATFAEVPPAEAFPRAQEAARHALQLDDSLAEAHISLAFALTLYEWNWDGAEKEYRRALELDPGNARAHHWYALLLAASGRLDEARAEMRRARGLDPLGMAVTTAEARILYYARRYPDSIAEFRRTLELYPNFALPQRMLGKAYLAAGERDQALLQLRAAVASNGGSVEWGDLGYAYGVLGMRADAVRVLTDLQRQSRSRYVSSYSMALVELGLGRKDEAFASLDRACDERASGLIYIQVEPQWDRVRSDPRFQRLAQRLGLATHTTNRAATLP